MKAILGTKEKMSQIFDETGKVIPVTIINADFAVVTQVKNKEKDGYNSIQIGSGQKSEKNINKAQKGQFKDLGNFRYVREFRIKGDLPEIKIGDKFEITNFEKGDSVRISAISKGKGFQGVVKRHGFHGGPRSHGQKHSEREPGSIGIGGVQKVMKGMRMAGRMGSDRITLKNVPIVAIDQDKKQIYLRGAIPGRKGTLIEIEG